MILVDRLIPFLVKHGITESQFILLYLVYLKRDDLIDVYKEKVIGGMKKIPKTEMEFLRQKGFLEFNSHNKYVLSEMFLNLFIDKHIATDEIFAIYPSYMESMGVQIPLTAMDRNVFANIYISAIQGNLEEHKEVIKDIEYAKQQKLLSFGIEKFLTSKMWLKIREQRLAGIVKTNAPNAYDKEF